MSHTEVQPQVVQLDLKFSAPLVKDSMVQNLSLLTTLQHNYLHKSIWVISEESFYYLINNDGSNLSDWKKFSVKSIISRYNSSSTYGTDEAVYYGNKIYVALKPVPVNISPINNSEYWLNLYGDISTFRFIFQNSGNFFIYTNVVNPIFEVFLCDFVLDGQGNLTYENNLVVVNNTVEIDPAIVRRYDKSDNGGKCYEVKIINNGEIFLTNGIINIK